MYCAPCSFTRRARVSAAACCCWSARSARTEVRSSGLATTVTVPVVTNARSRSRVNVPTGMCSIVRFLNPPTTTAGGLPPRAAEARSTHGAPSACSTSALATRRESVSCHRPERSVTAVGSMRATRLLLHAPRAATASAASATSAAPRRGARFRGAMDMLAPGESVVAVESPGCTAQTRDADHASRCAPTRTAGPADPAVSGRGRPCVVAQGRGATVTLPSAAGTLPRSPASAMFLRMRTTLSIDDSVMTQVRQEATRRGRSTSELVETALREFLAAHPDPRERPALVAFDGGGFADLAGRDAPTYDAPAGC